MDYEQDYSKLAFTDTVWYNRRNHSGASSPTDDESASTNIVILDNEDFN